VQCFRSRQDLSLFSRGGDSREQVFAALVRAQVHALVIDTAFGGHQRDLQHSRTKLFADAILQDILLVRAA
jgi:hypothetical protein